MIFLWNFDSFLKHYLFMKHCLEKQVTASNITNNSTCPSYLRSINDYLTSPTILCWDDQVSLSIWQIITSRPGHWLHKQADHHYQGRWGTSGSLKASKLRILSRPVESGSTTMQSECIVKEDNYFEKASSRFFPIFFLCFKIVLIKRIAFSFWFLL